MKIGKYSFGTGDRFSHEGVSQLKALLKAEKEFGVSFVPVWNKSNRASFRQLIHVSYKIAAELGDEYYPALEKHTDVIGEQIIENICERHIKRLFNK